MTESTATRRPRDTKSFRMQQPKLTSVLAVLAMAVTLGTLVWTMATLVSSKADKDTVHVIKTDVEIIKVRQELFIESVRPGLVESAK